MPVMRQAVGERRAVVKDVFICPSFTGCAVGKMPMEKVMKTIMPFYIAMFAALMLVTYVPWFSLFLPNLLMG